MHSVLLVDDDVAVLEFLRTMIPWEDCQFMLMGTCTNAYDALQLCRESMPDLIVTDIGMPGMDGIELIASVKDISLHTHFVILSCHDEFRYAQQAVQMGVQDYILKETLETQTIVKLLSRMNDKIEAEDQLQHEVRRLQLQAIRSKSALKEKWLRELLSSPFAENPLWREQLKDFGLHPVLPFFIPVLGRLQQVWGASVRYQDAETVMFIIENAVEELLKHEQDIVFFSYTDKEFCLLFNCQKQLKNNPYERIGSICKEVQRKLTHVLKLPVSIIVGEIVSDCSEIKRQMNELFQCSEHLFYSREPVFVKANESVRCSNQDEDLHSYYFEYAELMDQVMLDGNADVSVAVDPLINLISSRKFSPKAVKQFVFKLVLDMMKKLKFNQQYTNEKVLKELDNMGNIGELREWFIIFVNKAIFLMDQISKQSKKVEIIDAQKYVHLHMDQKITMEEVADHLHLNPSYFSRLFKKETGENFIEYVKRIKMEKAKELLSHTDKTVDTISQMLGYDNKGYFVKLFKQHYGTIPSQANTSFRSDKHK